MNESAPPASGLEYGPGEGETLAVYPATASGSTTVLLIHEGGWHEGNSKVGFAPLQNQAERLVANGFLAIVPDYPLTPAGGTYLPGAPSNVEAIERATEWAETNAAEYNGDGTHISYLGGSAGGHLAALAALRMNAAKAGTIKAVSALSGPMDLVLLAEEALAGEFNVGSLLKLLDLTKAELEAKSAPVIALEELYSPTAQTFANAPPFQLFGSSPTELVPYVQQTTMQEVCEAKGASVELITTSKGHAFTYWTQKVGGKAVYEYVIEFLQAY